jgi:pyrroloquinoline quinone (PQQ) biosynthesis protein C
MLPGVYGALRTELGGNLWDELGRGCEEVTHRNLRLAMMEHLGISPRAHLDDVRSYCWEELALANLYLKVVLDRGRLGQAIGAMLATETAVPGRMDCQLKGWRRVGVPADVLAYVAEHITVDVRHADGWMEEVVLPLLREHPAMLGDVAFGVVSRLDAAGTVCDAMLRHLNVWEM